MSKTLEALNKLDPNNDNHWTDDGLPRMDTMKLMAGDQSLTREAVTAASPGFSRSSIAPQEPAPQGATHDHAGDEVKPEGEEEATGSAFEDAQRAVVVATKRKEEAVQGLAKAQAQLDAILDERERTGANEKLSDQLSGYFERQKQNLQRRGEQLAQLKGIDLKAILPKRAPVDAAFARKDSRGGKRPTK